MARLTYKQLKTMSFEELNTKDTVKGAELLKQFREKFRFREKAFQRAKSVYSPALEKMQEYYERNGVQSPETMNINKIRSELFQLQDFFKAKTADVKGARQVMREQDERIFGLNEKGAPARRMTLEERTKFWEVYDEFLKTYKNAEAIYGSDKIQQYLGELTISGRKQKGVFRRGAIGMMQQLSALQKTLRENEGDYHANLRNVRQGR